MSQRVLTLLMRCSCAIRIPRYGSENMSGTFCAHNSRLKFFVFSRASYAADSSFDEIEPGEFGAIAKKKGVTVFKLPIDHRLPQEYSADEERPKPKFFSKYPPRWYFNQCRRLAKERKEMECLQFFEEKMLQEDQVFPEEENFTVVMGAMGRIGHVQKAFQLYSMMRDRAIHPSMPTYTALFNAVAQSKDSKNLRFAVGLYKKLHKRNIRMNRITYNALIKVFGRHGTTEQMMGIFRESMVAGFEPDSESFNMLLLCLRKDKEAGFRHAIEVWRIMLMLDVEPDGKSIMYLLKVLQYCGIGDTDTAYRKLFKDVPDPAEYKNFFKEHFRNVYWLKGQKSTPKKERVSELPLEHELLTIFPGVIDEAPLSDIEKVNNSDHEIQSEVTQDPLEKNDEEISQFFKPVSDIVLDGTVSMSSSLSPETLNLLQLPFQETSRDDRAVQLPVAIGQCKWPNQRLELIGGHKHVFEILEKYDIPPTVMLLSTLVQVLEPTIEAENELIEFVEKHKVKVDVDFFNLIMKKRVNRRDYRSVNQVLEKVVSFGLSPNYRTCCVTALTCRHGHRGVGLINELKNTNIELDDIFFNSLISAALRRRTANLNGYENVRGYDYRYLTRIIHEMKECNIKVTQRTIELLERASDWPEGYNRWELADQGFEREVFKFRKIYKNWLETVELKPEDKLFR